MHPAVIKVTFLYNDFHLATLGLYKCIAKVIQRTIWNKLSNFLMPLSLLQVQTAAEFTEQKYLSLGGNIQCILENESQHFYLERLKHPTIQLMQKALRL